MTLLRLDIHASGDVADSATDALLAHPSAINVTRARGVRLSPPGDLLTCDVPREAAAGLLDQLERLGATSGDACVTVASGLAHVSARADRAEHVAAGHASDALIWPLVRDTLEEETGLSLVYVAFIVLATMLGAIGVVFNSPILVIGAMVLGPEFGPLASLCVGLVGRDGSTVAHAALTLLVGFAVAIAGAVVFTKLLVATGVFPSHVHYAGLLKEVATPGWLYLVIALIAGCAGVLTLTSSRSGALIGVLISVTTIPAAAAAAVLTSYGMGDHALGAMLTLVINLGGIAAASIATVLVQAPVVRRLERPGSAQRDA
jgi:uncharacterized hydrophobic protein (TIGR00271 family)